MQGEAVGWSRRCRGNTSPSKRRKNVLGRSLTNLASSVGRCPFYHDRGLSQAGPSRQLLYVLLHVNTLQWDLSERFHTVDITGVRQLLKEGADRPENEVPGRVCLTGRLLERVEARSVVWLKDLLVGCGPNRSCCKDGQEMRPATHAGSSECRKRSLGAANPGVLHTLCIRWQAWAPPICHD